jgi:hypothetical protein
MSTAVPPIPGARWSAWTRRASNWSERSVRRSHPVPGRSSAMTASMSATALPTSSWPSSRSAAGAGRRSPRGASAANWARFVQALVDGRYKAADKVVLVMDQLNIHSPASLYEAFAPAEARRIADRLEIHHTPKHGSWLNMAEIELSALSRDLPERVDRREVLAQHVAAWQHRRNAARTKAEWRFATPEARIKLRKLYPTIEG